MNTKQEIIDAMNGEFKGDMSPPAIFTQTGSLEQMDACGIRWPEAFHNLDKLVGLALQPSELFGFACARVPFDITAESEVLGCELTPGSGSTQPAIIGSPWETEELPDPPEFMSPDEFISSGRCALHIQAAEKISKEHPELFVTSGMIDPSALAQNLIGAENYLMISIMDPDPILKWTEAVTPLMCEYAKALSEVSDNVMVIASFAEEMMSPDMIEQLVKPSTVELFSSVKESFTTAHSCGVSDNILESLASCGETALSVESWKDPQGVYDRVGDKVKLVGGVEPINCLMMGSPEDIVRSAKQFSDIGYPIIAPECGVPPQTPNRNLEALAKYREL